MPSESHRGTLHIFRDFRALVAALRELVTVLEQGVQAQRELGPARDRLDALELSRHHFEAEIQGVLLQADGKLKAAKNAEARERQLKRSYERQLDSGFEDIEESAAKGDTVLPVDAQASEAQGLQPVRLGLATNNKAHAVRAKFGL